MLFACLKRILGLDRLRLRGPSGAKDEFLLAATAQKLRKLAKLIPLPTRSSPRKAERPSFASLTAAADTHRGRLKRRFRNSSIRAIRWLATNVRSDQAEEHAGIFPVGRDHDGRPDQARFQAVHLGGYVTLAPL